MKNIKPGQAKNRLALLKQREVMNLLRDFINVLYKDADIQNISLHAVNTLKNRYKSTIKETEKKVSKWYQVDLEESIKEIKENSLKQ